MKKQNILAIAFIALIISIINLNLSAQCVNCDANSSASGSYASAMGMSANATGQASLAVGLEAYADGNYSLALGKYVTSTGASSVTLGRYLEAATSPAMIIGTGYNSSNYLVNSNSNSLMIGFNSNKSTLFVKGATGIGYTGKVGIGDVTDPQAKLHIKADQNEPATLLIEPYSFTAGESAKLRLGTMDYGISSGYGKLYFITGGHYIFNSTNANIGIGTNNPDAKLQINGDIFIEDANSGLILKSPNGQCWKININNNGNLNTVAIDCDFISGDKGATKASLSNILIYPNPVNNEVIIECKNLIKGFASIHDINGALLLKQQIFSGNNVVELGMLATGYYMITVYDENNESIIAEKILKK